jgi:hypothetical protein
MASKVVYTLIGILVITVVILVGLVGYLYGENATTRGQTTTVSYTSTQTITSTSTSTQTSTATITRSLNYTTTVSETKTVTTIPENLEITNSFVTRNPSDYTFSIGYKNTGFSEIFITEILFNDKPMYPFWSTAMVNGSSSIGPIKMGSSGVFLVTFPDKGDAKAFISGQLIEIKFNTTSGTYYVGTFLIP